MNLQTFKDNAMKSYHKAAFVIKKHSPEILMVAGTVGVVVGTALTVKATLKVKEITEPVKEDLNLIKRTANEKPEEYSEEDAKRDCIVVYVGAAKKMVKLYGPAVLATGLGLASMIKGHRILSKRNAALAIGYATLNTSFKDYRDRVVKKFGKNIENELFSERLIVDEVEVRDENGETAIIKNAVIDSVAPSPYARVFGANNPNYIKDPTMNRFFLISQQSYFNDILNLRGHLFLNDVYKALGFNPTPEGQVVGWIKGPDSDNFVDLGLDNVQNADFMNSVFGAHCLLEFNVDGVVYDLI